MPRRLAIPSLEMGTLELYLIYDEGGVWEESWRAFQGVWDLPVVSKEDMDHALCGWTRPLVNKLGPPPEGKLLQLPSAAKQCSKVKDCPFFEAKHCTPLHKKMPWCFAPSATKTETLAADVIRLWREGVYVVVVYEPRN